MKQCAICSKEIDGGLVVDKECLDKLKSLSIAEKLLWLVENVFQINIINNGCSIEIRPNNSCEEARYFIGVDAAYEWAKNEIGKEKEQENDR